MNKRAEYIGELSNEKLEILQKEHGKIDTIEVPMNDERTKFAVGYLKKIDRQLMGAALTVADPIAAKEMVLNSIFVGGEKSILTDDELFFSACTVVGELMSFRRAILKKN